MASEHRTSTTSVYLFPGNFDFLAVIGPVLAGFLLTGDILIHVQFMTSHIFPPFSNFLTALIQGTSIMCIELKDAKSVC